MSAKKSGFDGMKSGLMRMKQNVMVKLGKAESTIDVQFDQEKKRFDLQYKSLKTLKKSIEAYQKALKDLAVAHATMTEHVHALYDASCPLWNACLAQQKVTNDIDNLRNDLENRWQTDFFVPFSRHLGQYKQILSRCEERERRRIDMDRYRADVKSLLEKNDTKAQVKLPLAKEKAEAMTRAYQDLNAELIHDMPILLDDRFGFYDPCFAVIVDGQAEYFSKAGQSFTTLSAYFAGVDRQGSHTRPLVITPLESSSFSQPIHMPGGQVIGIGTKEKDYTAVEPKVDLHQAGLTDLSSNNVRSGFVTDSPSASYHHASASPYYDSTSTPPPEYHIPSSTPAVDYPDRARSGSFGQSTTNHPSGSIPTRGGMGRGAPSQTAPSSRPLPNPGLFKVRALYPFVAQHPNELSFEFNDVMTVWEQPGEWWKASHAGKGRETAALIPSTYVERI